MHFNTKKTKFRRMSIISNNFDVRTSQRVKNKSHLDDDRKRDKQLLTPNIKRFLKTWLLDHKEYPYPDRYEKIMLAQETGLTIMQICNWFANWRRKLKLYSKDFKRRSYKDKTDIYREVEDDSWSSQSTSPPPHQTSPPQHQTDSYTPDGDYNWTMQSRPNPLHVTKPPSEVVSRTPKIWRPQEDLCIENKDLMLLKWLKSISTFDSIKYHPCYSKYVWDSERVKQMLHGDTSEQYSYDKPAELQYYESPRPADSCDVHLDEVRQSDEILAAEILASFAQNRQAHANVC